MSRRAGGPTAGLVALVLFVGACSSSFAGGDDPNVGVGTGKGSASAMRVSLDTDANGLQRTLDPFVVAITDPDSGTTHVTYNSEVLNRGAFPDDAPQFFEAAIVGDQAFARNTPWPILPGGPDGILWGVWYRVDSFAFDDYQITTTDLASWLELLGQDGATRPVAFTLTGEEVAQLRADRVPLAGLASLVLPLEPEPGVRVTADADAQGRISSLVIEPVESGDADLVHRLDARFEHDAALASLGLGSAIDPPPESLSG